MQKTELISVIVPVYKVEEYLEQCLDALLKQTYKNLEIILVNDGSPDSCPSICDSYSEKDNRIKVIHKENGGISSARNAGLKESKGEYIYFLDSDDVASPFLLECLYSSMKDTGCDLGICAYTSEKNLCWTNSNKKVSTIISRSNVLEKIAFGDRVGGYVWNKLYKRSIIQELVFDESVYCNEDQIFSLQYASRIEKAVYIDTPMYFYRVRNDSLVTQQWNNRKVTVFEAYLKITKLMIKVGFSKEMIARYAGIHSAYLAINYFVVLDKVSEKNYWKKRLLEIYYSFIEYGAPQYQSIKKKLKAIPFNAWIRTSYVKSLLKENGNS